MSTGYLFLVLCSLLVLKSVPTQGDCQDIEISGLGWDDPGVILPSRFFFVRNPCNASDILVDITSSRGLKDKECLIKTKTSHGTSTSVTIVRYRLVTPVCRHGITITILDNETKQVLKSKQFSSPVYSEECDCPTSGFISSISCHDDRLVKRVLEDLDPFIGSHGNFSIWLNHAIQRFASFPRSYSFCHYKIVDNEVG